MLVCDHVIGRHKSGEGRKLFLSHTCPAFESCDASKLLFQTIEKSHWEHFQKYIGRHGGGGEGGKLF